MIERLGLGAKLARFAGGLSTRFYVILAALVALGVATSIAVGAYRDAIADAEKRGAEAAYARVGAKAIMLERKAAKLAAAIRRTTDETNRRIAGAADDLRLRGPGKAACPGAARPAAGGHVPAARPADAPVDQVPDPERVDLIALPFADAIAFAEQHDLNRAEVLSWRQYQCAAPAAASNPKE